MGQVQFTRLAREDLLGLWAYIACSNRDAADRLFDRIEASCQRLRDHPQLGPTRPDIAVDARALVIDHWLALYRLTDNGVQVVRFRWRSRPPAAGMADGLAHWFQALSVSGP